MKNITVAVSDEAYKTARLWAANSGSSVSAIVQLFIEKLLPRIKSDPNDPKLIKGLRQQIHANDNAARSASDTTFQTNTSRSSEAAPEPFSKLHRICEALSLIEQNQQVAALPITVSPTETVKNHTDSV